MSTICFVTGGARSGKSGFAESRALELMGDRNQAECAYLATGEALDEEFSQRIAHHRQSRDRRFRTIEEGLHLAAALETARAWPGLDGRPVVLLECLSTWLGNVFHHLPEADQEGFALDQADRLAATCRGAGAPGLVVVSNEIGMGIVPLDAYTRRYRDVHGRINRRLAEAADEAWLLVSGLPLRLK